MTIEIEENKFYEMIRSAVSDAITENLDRIKNELFNYNLNDAIINHKLSDTDWQQPGRAATDEEIEELANEMENDVSNYSPDEAKFFLNNRFAEWRKKDKKLFHYRNSHIRICRINLQCHQ